MKIAYQTDSAGMWIGETIADESPLEPDVFLIPAGATLTPPPTDWPDGKWPRWNGSSWDLVTCLTDKQPLTAAQKLADFLAQNPDVVSLINDGGANV